MRPDFAGLLPGAPLLPDPRVKALAEDQHGGLWIEIRADLFRLASVRRRHRLDRFAYDGGDRTSLHDAEMCTFPLVVALVCGIGTWGGGDLARLDGEQLLAEGPRFQRFSRPQGDHRGLRAEVVKFLRTFWTTTPHGSNCPSLCSELVDFELGAVNLVELSNQSHRAWCVRGGTTGTVH